MNTTTLDPLVMPTTSASKSFSLLWHWMRKDFTAMRGWFIAWAVLLVTHCVLRLVQLYAGDYVLPEIFLFTHRPDHILQWILLAVTVPMVIQQDSPVGANFWKARPLKPGTLLVEKLCLVIGWFVLLPLMLDLIYFGLAGFRGWDLVLAILYWALPRAAATLFLATVASLSNDLGRLFIHLVFVLLLALASWVALIWPSYWGSEIPFYRGLRLYTAPFNELLSREFYCIAVIVFSVALGMRYCRRWSVLACWVFCFASLLIYRVGTGIVVRTYYKMTLSERNLKPELPAQAAGISLNFNLGAQGPFELGEFKLIGRPTTQNAIGMIMGGTVLLGDVQIEIPASPIDESGQGLHINKSTFSNLEELRNQVSGYEIMPMFLPKARWPVGRLDSSVIEVNAILHCSMVEASIDYQITPGSEEWFQEGHSFVSYHPQRSLKQDPRGTRQLSETDVLELQEHRFGLSPFPAGHLSRAAIENGSNAIALQEIRSGKIIMLHIDKIPHRKWQDTTRFRASQMHQLTTALQIGSTHAAIVKSFRAHPEDWRIIFILPKVVEEFDLPIHLSKGDLEHGLAQAKDRSLPDLTLHFNPTTQRWETTSEP